MSVSDARPEAAPEDSPASPAGTVPPREPKKLAVYVDSAGTDESAAQAVYDVLAGRLGPGFTVVEVETTARAGDPDELGRAEAEVDRLADLAVTLGVRETDLDEHVHEVAAWPASDVNNSGLGGQVAFLIRQAGPADAERMIREAAQRGTGAAQAADAARGRPAAGPWTDADQVELARLEAAFDHADGRGVELAEQIDKLRARRGAAPRLIVLPGDQPRHYDYAPEELDLLIRSAGELWDGTSGHDPYDVLSALQRGALDLAAAAYRGELDRYPAEKLDLLIRSAGELWDSTDGQGPHHCSRCGQALPTAARSALDRAAALFQYELNREMGYEDAPEPDQSEENEHDETRASRAGTEEVRRADGTSGREPRDEGTQP